MASPLQRRLKDREDGLGLIVGQLAKVKRRINLVAAQQMAFLSLGLLIGAAGLLVIAAFFLTTAHFLALAVVLAVTLLAALPAAIILTLRRFAGLDRTAAIVDQKAELNGRASTLLAMAERDGDYSLWPFLVEDTLGRLDDFQPQRIEKHRISPAIYGFAAACLVASLAGLMTYSARRHQEALRKILKNFTLEVDPSEIAPSDNPSEGGATIEGDPDTLRSLADRLEAANQNSHGANHNPINQLAHKAKDLASSLQDKLTGREFRDTPQKVKLRLAQAMGDTPPPEDHGSSDSSSNPSREKAGHQSPNAGSGTGARKSNPDAQQQLNGDQDSGPPSQSAAPPNSPSAKGFDPGGPEGPGSGDEPVAGQKQGSSPEASGQTAGGGSDPDHLMGPPDAPTHKNENFEIMIDARLSDRSPIASAQPYVPPRVKTALSTYQHPDEPLDRGTVPPSDRDTIRRVFER
jgi:hypothetical protein